MHANFWVLGFSQQLNAMKIKFLHLILIEINILTKLKPLWKGKNKALAKFVIREKKYYSILPSNVTEVLFYSEMIGIDVDWTTVSQMKTNVDRNFLPY